MSILLIACLFSILIAFISDITNHPFLCSVNIMLAILMAFLAMAYEGRLLNRIKKLEQEVEKIKREGRHEII